MSKHFTVWTGGGPADPEASEYARAIEELPPPENLPRSALVTYWWGETRFDVVLTACSIRETPWGDDTVTWLHCKGAPVSEDSPGGAVSTLGFLVPAHYVTSFKPGPTFEITDRGTSDTFGLFAPNRPDPPHALPLYEIESVLASLADVTDEEAGYVIRYPLYVLRRRSGEYVRFGRGGDKLPADGGEGVPVFTTEDGADSFLRDLGLRPAEVGGDLRGTRVVEFDRSGPFRRFLQAIGDSGAHILFDPAVADGNVVYADRSFPAAVLLERHLPPIAWGFSYPLYVLRIDGPRLSIATSAGAGEDGVRRLVVPVFTDDDLAGRALAHVPKKASVMAVPDATAFGEILRQLPSGTVVTFDHEQTAGGKAKVAFTSEGLLANLDDFEL